MRSKIVSTLESLHNSGEKATHCFYDGKNTKYFSLSKDEYGTFFKDYCVCVNKAEQNLLIGEAVKDVVHLSLVFDFKFELERTPDVSKAFQCRIIEIVQKLCLEFFQIEDGDIEQKLICARFSCNPINSGNLVVETFKLHFPFLKFVRKEYTKFVVALNERLEKEKIFDLFSYRPLNKITEVVRMDFYSSKFVPLYMSSESSTAPVFVFEDLHGLVDSSSEDYQEFTANSVFDVLDQYPNLDKIINKNEILKKSVEHWLPIIFSTLFCKVTTEIKRRNSSKKKRSRSKNNNDEEDDENDENVENQETDLDFAFQLIEIMSDLRRENESCRTDIGKALWNISDGSGEARDFWVTWAEKYQKKNTSKELWSSFENDNVLNILTLREYAEIDSPSQFEKLVEDKRKELLLNALSGTPFDIAELLYEMVCTRFICSSNEGTKHKWWMFSRKDNHWIDIGNGSELRKYISKELVKMFEAARAKFAFEATGGQKGKIKKSDKRIMELERKECENIIANLKKTPFKGQVMKEAADLFLVREFESHRDNDPYLYCTRNCVLVLSDFGVSKREGKSQDYCTKCAGTRYIENLNWEDEDVKTLMDWFTKIFLFDEKMRDQYLKYKGSCLQGKNRDKKIVFMCGNRGNEGKSTVTKLDKLTHGAYMFKIPMQSLQARTKAGNANPDLARGKGCRYGVADEPDEHEELNSGIVKGMTGGDSYVARLLFSNGDELENLFKMALVCNKVPKFSSIDNAIKERCLIFPFLAMWSKKAPKSEEEQKKTGTFPTDKYFEDSLKRLTKAYLWILVEYYKKYIEEKDIFTTDKMQEALNNYYRNNDQYFLFYAERIEKYSEKKEKEERSSRSSSRRKSSSDEKKKKSSKIPKLHIKSVFSEFKIWWKETYPSSKIPDKRTMIEHLIPLMGDLIDGRYWKGFSFAAEEEEE